ncbi:hypothetical protein, partial [Nonomuraea sp. NPDC049784]|uniref:hypothetical protein n=1 Tax=Nonomuraea sp. NPDC049784 TaxID=3154361 RepID=UPI0033ECFFD6
MSEDRKQKPSSDVAHAARRIAFRQRYRAVMATPFVWATIALPLSAALDAQQPAVGMLGAAAACALPM